MFKFYIPFQIVTSSYTDLQDYTYYFVPAPWLSVKLLRLLQNYTPPGKCLTYTEKNGMNSSSIESGSKFKFSTTIVLDSPKVRQKYFIPLEKFNLCSVWSLNLSVYSNHLKLLVWCESNEILNCIDK